jgi:ABC-type nickel/cobalt efflux system permease component RcnA
VNNNNSNSSSGMGCGGFFAALLTVAFVVLKLCNVIDWSWWWVFSPLWITVGISLLIIVIIAIITLIAHNVSNNKAIKRREAFRKQIKSRSEK